MMTNQQENLGEPNARDFRYWEQLVEEHPQAGNIVQYDPASPFEELRCHNTNLHLVVAGFYSLASPADVVILLLGGGANPNIQNDKGETPLHFVCQATMRNPVIAKLLLSHRADPRIQTLEGKKPVDFLGQYDRYSREIRALLQEAAV